MACVYKYLVVLPWL
uniref:Uncharacterized protein n=1 Tax=Arundo donax TaxID=35708 RepID=A0A0A9GTV4_ARUDO